MTTIQTVGSKNQPMTENDDDDEDDEDDEDGDD